MLHMQDDELIQLSPPRCPRPQANILIMAEIDPEVPPDNEVMHAAVPWNESTTASTIASVLKITTHYDSYRVPITIRSLNFLAVSYILLILAKYFTRPNLKI